MRPEYAYSQTIREEIASCYGPSYECKDKRLCVNQTEERLGLGDHPWLAGVPASSFPF